jgi:hypothetical protein
MLIRLDHLNEDSPFAIGTSSPGYPGSGDIGTQKVVRPEYRTIADQWRASGGTKDKAAWTTYAERLGVWPEDIEKGWEYLSASTSNKPQYTGPGEPSKDLPPAAQSSPGLPVGKVTSRATNEAVSPLKRVFGEATSWWGYSVPNLFMLNMPSTPAPFPGFGFHTKTAEKVWDQAKKIAAENPKMKTDEIVAKAIEATRSLSTELTPEDGRLLDMAINWYLAGKMWDLKPPTNIRSGGAPGGSFRSVEYGHTLAGRGAP